MKNQAMFLAAQAGVVPLVEGMPGIAKTATVLAFGKATGREVYTLIGSIREPADIGGYPMLRNGDQPACMEFVPPRWVHTLNAKPGILFIDEATNCPPAVQACFMRITAERYVGDTPLRPETWIIMAANPVEQAAGGYDLEPPMANRVCHLKWEIDWASWDQGLMNGLEFPEPKVTVLPPDWETKIRHWASLAVAFRNKRATLFAQFPEDRSKTSGAWPSPRSWTNGIRCLAAATSVGASEEVQHELLSGCIGTGPASEFFHWQRDLDIPSPEELLRDAAKQIKAGGNVTWKKVARPDQMLAALGGMVALAIERKDAESWLAAMLVCTAACDQWTDVAVSCASNLAKANVVPKGKDGKPARLPEETIRRMGKIMVAV